MTDDALDPDALDAHLALDRETLRKVGRFDVLGSTGLVRFGDDVDEEWLHALRDQRGVRAYREMRDNDSVVGASIYAIQSLVRSVRWRVDAAELDEDDAEGLDVDTPAAFLEEALEDMSHTWEEFLAEVVSMIWFGWSWFEKVYKVRGGKHSKDPTRRSRFDDGRIGWRKISIRAQETLDGWEFDEDGGIRGMWQVAAPDFHRVLIPIEKSVLFRTELSKNNPEGRSLLRNAYRSWFFLKRLQELEAIGIERDLAGLPVTTLPLAYFGSEATPAKKTAKENFAKMTQQVRRNEHEGIVFPAELDEEGKPTGYKFSLMGSPGSRQINVDAAIQRYEKRMAMTLLTQFLFLGMDKVGSFSLSSDQTDLFASALGTLLDSVEETFNRFCVAELMELNGFPEETWPRLRHGDIEKPDVEAFANTLVKLADGGLLTPDGTLEAHVREELNLPPAEEPADDETEGVVAREEETDDELEEEEEPELEEGVEDDAETLETAPLPSNGSAGRQNPAPA